LARRACSGQAPRAARRALAEQRDQGRQVAGVERAVAVHEADDRRLGGAQAREAGGAEAAVGLGDDGRAELGGDSAGAVG
jgi:hypothetical protein